MENWGPTKYPPTKKQYPIISIKAGVSIDVARVLDSFLFVAMALVTKAFDPRVCPKCYENWI